MANIMFLDTETTGLNSKLNGIVKIAYIIYDTDLRSVIGRGEELVNPGKVLIDEKAMQINKIDINFAKSEGISAELLGQTIWDLVYEYDVKRVAGWNINFDIEFIKECMKKEDQIHLHKKLRKIDLRILGYLCLDLDYYSLENVAKELEIEYIPHNCMSDVSACVKIYKVLWENKNKESDKI